MPAKQGKTRLEKGMEWKLRSGPILLLQTIDAVDAVLAGELAPTADGLVGGGAAAGGTGGEVHLAFGVLVH